MSTIWDSKYETLTREDIEQLQLERLQSTLNRIYKNVPVTRAKLDENSILPEDITSLSDLARLPFTTRADHENNYPYGMFALPLREIVRIHSSSGTKGVPVVVGYTHNDLKNWSALAARVLTAGGVNRDDVVQIAFGYGMFTGGFGMHYGAELIGASVIPSSTGYSGRQVTIMKDFRTTALVATPSYALLLVDQLEEAGIAPSALTLKYGLFGGEPWSEAMRSEIEEKLHIVATDNYGLSEIMGPGIAGECMEKNGLHLNEDYFIAEIVDPDTGEVLPHGSEGELVLTTLKKEAFPMLRYRTGDITSLNIEPCACGRTTARISRIKGRTDDMLIVRGVNVFPSQIEQALLEVEGCQPHYRLTLDKSERLTNLLVEVEVHESIFFEEMKKQVEFIRKVEHQIKTKVGLTVQVKLVEPKSIERRQDKSPRVNNS
jgi:phenylacetate-CoA ligase